jgi:hypothetical protein
VRDVVEFSDIISSIKYTINTKKCIILLSDYAIHRFKTSDIQHLWCKTIEVYIETIYLLYPQSYVLQFRFKTNSEFSWLVCDGGILTKYLFISICSLLI